MPAHKHRDQIQRYNVWWNHLIHPIQIEMEMIKKGGQWTKRDGSVAGEGLFFHLKRMQQLLHPEKVWHKWNDLLLKNFIEKRVIGVMGPASSGKTREAADFAREIYYCFPDCTTVICTSTEKETLEDRVWGEIKNQHRLARQQHEWIPGHLIESKQRLVTDARNSGEAEDGRDFRNGMVGVPTKKGGAYQGMGAFAGRKNKIVILIADEASLLPRIFVDAFANLSKNNPPAGSNTNPLFGFKGIAMGNPKDTTDALGVICEPSPELGGWDGGIDQTPETKTWNIRWPDGVCVQLPGSDSPNLDGKLGIPLISQEHIDADVSFYGKDSLQFTMMNQGMMPRGQGSRRILTRQMCLKFQAMEEIVWKDNNRTKIGFIDAAYRGVGGDRTIFGELQYGSGIDQEGKERQMMSLIDTMLVPVSVKIDEMPEDQIALFVKDQCEKRGIAPEKVFFDSTGRGSLMSAFARLWSPHVQCVEFGGVASERHVSMEIRTICRDYYFNFVSELWYAFRMVVESRQFRGLTEDVMQEFCYREWTHVGANKIQVEPKDKMKIKSGRSPDLADALVVGLEGARRNGFVIQKLSVVKAEEPSVWKEKLKERARELHYSHTLNYSV
jgi:hypothetical protein